jgi:hypothetical protein
MSPLSCRLKLFSMKNSTSVSQPTLPTFFTPPLCPPARWILKGARPEACVRKTGFILGSSVPAQGTSERHRLPLTEHFSVEFEPGWQATDADGPPESVLACRLTRHFLAFREVDQGAHGGGATVERLLENVLTHLAPLRRIDSAKSEASTCDLDRITVNNSSFASDRVSGERWECQHGKGERSGEEKRAAHEVRSILYLRNDRAGHNPAPIF